MGLSENDERLVADLQSSWTSHNSHSGLNWRLRNNLRSFAKNANLSFQVTIQFIFLTGRIMLMRKSAR